MMRFLGIWAACTAAVCLAAGAVAQPAGDPAAASFRDAFLAGRIGWEEVGARARQEKTVKWFIWGGNELLNGWVERYVVPEMAKLGITLNVARIPNTRDAVDLIIADNAAGRGIGRGTVDAVWINGANTLTLGTQGALLGAFAPLLPSARYFNFDPASPAARMNLYDLGYPTEGRLMPWGSAQYVCYIDTARLPRAKAPHAFADLEPYLRANPGRFTYIKPPHFNGVAFVQTVLYATNPDGYRPFQKDRKDLTVAEFTRLITPGFEFLRRIEPFLLGGGGKDGRRGAPIYPDNPAASHRMFSDGEIDMGCGFGTYGVSVRVADGTFPATAETLAFPRDGMIQNKNFIAIANNAPHPAAALVLVNFLSQPDAQISKLRAMGNPLGADLDLFDTDQKARVKDASPKLSGTTIDELNAMAVPDFNASLVTIIERIWGDYIERRSTTPLPDLIAAAFTRK